MRPPEEILQARQEFRSKLADLINEYGAEVLGPYGNYIDGANADKEELQAVDLTESAAESEGLFNLAWVLCLEFGPLDSTGTAYYCAQSPPGQTPAYNEGLRRYC